MSVSVSLPTRPKSTRPIRPSVEDEHVGRVRVAVEEPVPEDHLHPGLGGAVGELAPLLERRRLQVEVGELDAVQVLEREHPARRSSSSRPSARRRAPSRRSCGGTCPRAAPRACSRAPGGCCARTRRRASSRVDEVERADALLDHPRRLVEQREVGLDLPRRVRPLHLDDHLVAVRERRAVHLADRGRRDRLPPRSSGTPARSSARAPPRRPRAPGRTGTGRTSSCSPRSSATMSGGTTSGRVESSWPNLTNVGPSSSSISRRCRPRSEPVASGSASTRLVHGKMSVSLCRSKK